MPLDLEFATLELSVPRFSIEIGMGDSKKGGEVSTFYAHVDAMGPIQYRQLVGSSISVHDSLEPGSPIGIANRFTWDENNLAVWRLTIGKRWIEGRWIIVDKVFVRVDVK
jgi:hypothetical protein